MSSSPVPSPRAHPPPRTPDAVLEMLRARETTIHSLKGLFQADVRAAHLPVVSRIHGTLFYRRPHSIRVTGLTRAGGTLFDFLLRGDVYALRLPEHPDVMVGRVSDLDSLGDVAMPVRLSLFAVDLILGKAPPPPRVADVLVEGDTYRYIAPVSFPDGGRRHVLVDRASALMRAVEFRTPEEEIWAALSAWDFRPVRSGHGGRAGVAERAGSLALPFAVHASEFSTPGSVDLAFLELEANVALPDRTFHAR